MDCRYPGTSKVRPRSRLVRRSHVARVARFRGSALFSFSPLRYFSSAVLARDFNPGTLSWLDMIVTEQRSPILSRNAAERGREKVSAAHVRARRHICRFTFYDGSGSAAHSWMFQLYIDIAASLRRVDPAYCNAREKIFFASKEGRIFEKRKQASRRCWEWMFGIKAKSFAMMLPPAWGLWRKIPLPFVPTPFAK